MRIYTCRGTERTGPHSLEEIQARLEARALSPSDLAWFEGSQENGKRELSRVEMIIGPAQGAEMLLAGIKTIHARHPTNPEHEFITQVLATGRVREP